MKRFFVICIMLFSIGLFAQEQGLIKGIVLDQEMANDPMLYANLELKGTSMTTQSNLFGKFEMTAIEPGSYTLAISQAGYETAELIIEVKANEVTEIQQSLGAEKLSLEEFNLVTENSKAVDNLYPADKTERE